MTERERLIMELLHRDDALVIFIVDETPAVLGEWQAGGPRMPAGMSALYREGRCRLPEWHEGECEP